MTHVSWYRPCSIYSEYNSVDINYDICLQWSPAVLQCVMLPVEQIKEVLKSDAQIQSLAKELYQQKSILVMGRGYNYATCLEGALVSTYTGVHRNTTAASLAASSVCTSLLYAS